MGNLKDTITNICGIIIAIGGSILALVTVGTLVLPTVVNTVLVVLVTVATALIGYFTGKQPDGAIKTTAQIIKGNQK